MSHEDRFVDIEIKLAQQEDLVDTLNQTVYQQSRRIDQLEAMLAQLARHMTSNAQSTDNAQSGNHLVNEKPPHY